MQTPAELYVEEAQDLLTQIEDTALELVSGTADDDALNRLFRAFHTIKGSGAMFGFTAIAEFTHHLESALDEARSSGQPLTAPWLEIILEAKDHIRALLLSGATPADQAHSAGLLHRLSLLTGGSGCPEPAPVDSIRPAAATGPVQTYLIEFCPPRRIGHTGFDPALLLRDLAALGITAVTTHSADLPAAELLDPELCYLRWSIRLDTAAELNAIRDVFIFVEDESCVSITLLVPTAAAVPVARFSEGSDAVDAARVATSRSTAPTDASVRVPAERLDRLVGLVGELVMNQSRLSRSVQRAQSADLAAPVEAFERLIAELRDTVLSIRMTPIGSTFGRFRRLVHDLSRDLSKDVVLATSGEETELDKTVLDRLADPLVHLIRNSLDHGIEGAETRRAAGKVPTGTVRLSAQHHGTEVQVCVEDDGQGLDPIKLRARAIEKGLIAAGAVLSDREALELIFLPGFSTAARVTAVSGRGVGMDVVKRQVEALRGTVTLASDLGRGTTITLTLPMTLAIIDGLMVEVAGDSYILPLSAVLENVELSRSRAQSHVIPVRGQLVPFIRLRQVLALAAGAPDYEKVVVVSHEGQRVGLVVDRVVGTHQTVIQPLSRFCRNIDVLSGTTIMGDGRVALILDVAGVLRRDATSSRTTAA